MNDRPANICLLEKDPDALCVLAGLAGMPLDARLAPPCWMPVAVVVAVVEVEEGEEVCWEWEEECG